MRTCSSLLAILLIATAPAVLPVARAADPHSDLQLFIDAASRDEGRSEAALAVLAESWRDDYTALLVDFARFMRPRRQSRGGGGGGTGEGPEGAPRAAGSGAFPTAGPPQPEDPSTKVRERLVRFLEEQTGQDFGASSGSPGRRCSPTRSW
jgi:hypothetical protein